MATEYGKQQQKQTEYGLTEITGLKGEIPQGERKHLTGTLYELASCYVRSLGLHHVFVCLAELFCTAALVFAIQSSAGHDYAIFCVSCTLTVGQCLLPLYTHSIDLDSGVSCVTNF
jgi:hypothetical protein